MKYRRHAHLAKSALQFVLATLTPLRLFDNKCQTPGHKMRLALLLLASLGLFSCGRSNAIRLATVEGVITDGGNPLPDATVEFEPVSGRPSIGQTDESGHYELYYLKDRKGALIGQFTVRVTPAPSVDASTKTDRVQAPPMVAPIQLADSMEVKEGKNTINFDLANVKVISTGR